jgi:hypothetical protein
MEQHVSTVLVLVNTGVPCCALTLPLDVIHEIILSSYKGKAKGGKGMQQVQVNFKGHLKV